MTENNNFSDYYYSIRDKAKDFLEKIHQESDETKEAFSLMISSINGERVLTEEEEAKIGEQFKDILKTIGLVGATILPGGFLYFLIAKVFKLNKFVLPSSFNKETPEEIRRSEEKSIEND